MYYRLPKSELSLKYKELLKIAYTNLYNSLKAFDSNNLIVDKSYLYELTESLSILRSVTGITEDLNRENKQKMAKLLGENYNFIKNLVLLRNTLYHPYDIMNPDDINVKDPLNSVIDISVIIKVRRYFNGCSVIQN